MASISKITINGFKAFPKEFNLNLDGKNLLMYGENGSGKSSIMPYMHCCKVNVMILKSISIKTQTSVL